MAGSWNKAAERVGAALSKKTEPRKPSVLAEPERSSSFLINQEWNDPGNYGNEMNPGNDQAHFVRVKMPTMMRHEIGRNMIE
jgi:hypothetical protein